VAVLAIVPSRFNAGLRPPLAAVFLAVADAARRLVSARVSPSIC
jgi:hypothetical protein